MARGARAREEQKTIFFQLPIRGLVAGINDTEIDTDGLFSTANAVLRSGTLRGRPGYQLLHAQLFDSQMTGAVLHYTTAEVALIIAASLGKVWTYDFSSWTDRSGTLGGSADKPARIAQLVFGTPAVTHAYICNDNVALQTWATGDGSISAVSGSPPTFKDLIGTADRLLGLVGAHEVRWGDPLSDSTWSSLNQRFLSESPAHTVGITALGTIGAIVYKRDSIWIGQATGATGAQAFCFDKVGDFDGPANAAAIVRIRGADLYMTEHGRVAMFTGVSHDWIADGAWSTIKAEIDQTKPGRIRGEYHRQEEEVWFHYVRTGDSGEAKGLLIIKLPAPKFKLPHYACFVGSTADGISAGVSILRNDSKVPILFTSTSGVEKSYTLDGSDDAGMVINSHIQTGLQPLHDNEPSRVLNVESFLERAGGFGTALVKLATSNILDKPEGTLTSAQTIDLTSVPVKEPKGFDTRGRFVAYRLDWDSSDTVKYRGAILRSKDQI